jgi:acyl-coenzyme A thioesterase PaaI-like protein
MFEYKKMSPSAATLSPSSPTMTQTMEQVQGLQARIRQMQATKLSTRNVQTHPALAPLLPGGSLHAGAAYSVDDSAMLVMALLAGPSSAGAWCGVVGMPDFGAEAAARLGIDLERLVLVPTPGDQWLTVTAAIIDVLTVVVTKPPSHTSDANVARLNARLRQRDATLIVLGDWPQSEARLSISGSTWQGLGPGHGYLSSRQVTLTVTGRNTMEYVRSGRLWLPDDRERFRAVDVVGQGQELREHELQEQELQELSLLQEAAG